MPAFNKISRKWVIVINGQVRFYTYYEEALAALVRAA